MPDPTKDILESLKKLVAFQSKLSIDVTNLRNEVRDLRLELTKKLDELGQRSR